MSPEVAIPSVPNLLWPTLRALKDLGGSGTIQEVVEKVIALEGFTEEQQSRQHLDGPRSELEYRLAWARSYLKIVEAIDNSARGVWAITEIGRGLENEDMNSVPAQVRAVQQLAGKGKKKVESTDGDVADTEPTWDEQLLAALLELAPDQFERLASRLLREAGFISTTVTGKSGDGGIDGIGIYRVSLLSFPIFFQCKRHKGGVGSGAVRDFRGAMAGRGDKGLLITTGAFTADARQEATRDGAPPIDLIDGQQLCVLLKEYGLGVDVRLRQVEEIEIRPDFFTEI